MEMPSPESPNPPPTTPPTPKISTSKVLMFGLPIIVLALLIGFFGFKALGTKTSVDQNKDQANEEATSTPDPTPPPTIKPNPTPPPATKKDTTPPKIGVTITPVPQPPKPPPTPPAPANATITYTGSGFSPSSVTVGSGGKLTIVNSGGSLAFYSLPHPAHSGNSQLNIGDISSSIMVTLTTKGTFGVHNHNNPSETATVVVN